jgi:osmotically-inducible protein OsmY
LIFTTQVRMTLLYYHSISALHTQVEMKNGMVTLVEKARTAAEKDLLTQMVSNIHGVKIVKNQMAIEKAKSY